MKRLFALGSLCAVALGTLLVPSGRADAATILYFSDLTIGTDRMAEALANLGPDYSVTTVTSSDDFETQLAGGGYDLGIFFAQNFPAAEYGSAVSALSAFVAGGGRAIYADWSRNDALAAGFGASFTGEVNQDEMTITEASLAAGLTNPVSLTNPGWGVFSTGLDGGSIAATFGGGDGAIVIGNFGRSIVNGFLNDTFTDGADGVQLYTNEILFVLNSGVIPEPSSILLFGVGGVGLLGLARRRGRAGTAIQA